MTLLDGRRFFHGPPGPGTEHRTLTVTDPELHARASAAAGLILARVNPAAVTEDPIAEGGTSRNALFSDARLRHVEQDAETTWTPGQALGEITAHLARVESFTATHAAAEQVQARTRRLTGVLRAAVRRAGAAGVSLDLDGVLGALQRHDSLLASGQSVQAPAVREARDLIRLEISCLLPPSATDDPVT